MINRTAILAGVAFGLLSIASARAEDACMKLSDLDWSASVKRSFALIDTDRKGRVTGAQVKRFLLAERADRNGRKDRLETAMRLPQ